MTTLLRPLMWFGVAGFVAGLVVHVLALAGLPSPFGRVTWLLHIGVFVVWLPMILVAHRLTRGAKQSDVWKAALRGCPGWVKPGAYVLMVYTVVNFVAFMFQAGQYARNAVPDSIEYRGFSGHWMIFYYIATAVLYSAVRLGLNVTRCANGHEVSPFAAYCDVCGTHLNSPGAEPRGIGR